MVSDRYIRKNGVIQIHIISSFQLLQHIFTPSLQFHTNCCIIVYFIMSCVSNSTKCICFTFPFSIFCRSICPSATMLSSSIQLFLFYFLLACDHSKWLYPLYTSTFILLSRFLFVFVRAHGCEQIHILRTKKKNKSLKWKLVSDN